MGVCGSGKTVVGRQLGPRLGLAFRDGDEFHPRANIDKMSAGVPLSDDDRWPWLDAIGAAIGKELAAGRGIIVGCSALKRSYRERILAAAGRPVLFVWLDAARETLKRRLESRRNHFMPASLLDSQLAILEPPAADEPAIRISVEPPLEQVIAATIAAVDGRDGSNLLHEAGSARPSAQPASK